MSFSSLSFLFFFIVVAIAYFRLPYRFRPILLLGASLWFYLTFEAWYVLLLVPFTLLAYIAAIRMAATGDRGQRRTILSFTLAVLVGTLFAFKYYNLLGEALSGFLAGLGITVKTPRLSLILPVGLSFYSFKLMNYLIDVYRGRMGPERRLTIFALYASFFPQMVAGPIDRASAFLPQLHGRFDFDYRRVTSGMRLMLWGFFQKLVIADTLSAMADPVFNQPTAYQGPALFLASLCFTFQIYADFSGYSDIAIGAARIFGYTSMTNFERPYFASSIPEFWRRWHISLSTWFRDYLYIPLGGNRVAQARWYINLFLVFLLSGLWHGSNWTFAIWGSVHGLLYILSVLTEKMRGKMAGALGFHRVPRLHRFARILSTLVLVNFAWVFFRAGSVSDGFYIIAHSFTGWTKGLGTCLSFVPSEFELVVALGGIAVLLTANYLQEKGSVEERLLSRPAWLRWAVYYGGVLAILLFGNLGVKNFIYFQF